MAQTLITTNGESEITLSTTSTQVLPINTARNYLLIQNNDANINIYVKFVSAHTGSQIFILIPAGGNYEPEVVPIDAIFLKSASGAPVATVISGVNP